MRPPPAPRDALDPPRALNALPPREEDLVVAAASSPQGEFAPVCDETFRSAAKLIQ